MMSEYADDNRELGTVLRTRMMPELHRDDGGNIVWLPLTREDEPAHDKVTQYLEQTIAIGADDVTYGWVVRDFPPPPPPPAKTPEQVQAEFSAAIQARLDGFAQERLYDSILSACTYATSTEQTFAAEGQRCVTLRDATWRAAWTILAEVQAGTRTAPTPEELFDLLPDLTWE
jgi:hypothetical protein